MENNQNNYVPPVNNYVPPAPPAQPPVYNTASYGQNPSNVDPHIIELSQPNYNAPFDVITLPSKGKLYPNKKASIRLAYMTTADENILTSPNLLQSGKFLEILINRKILEPDLRYKDLHIGDRNAIMLWLRATGYGEMYPVVLQDENGEEFETDINLDDLETKDLGAEPDADGLFDLITSKNNLIEIFSSKAILLFNSIDFSLDHFTSTGFFVSVLQLMTLKRINTIKYFILIF